jgi:hypothetical protein
MAAAGDVPPLVSPQWLAERLGKPGVKVLDVSWYMPAMGERRVLCLVFGGSRLSGGPVGGCDKPRGSQPVRAPAESDRQ